MLCLVDLLFSSDKKKISNTCAPVLAHNSFNSSCRGASKCKEQKNYPTDPYLKMRSNLLQKFRNSFLRCIIHRQSLSQNLRGLWQKPEVRIMVPWRRKLRGVIINTTTIIIIIIIITTIITIIVITTTINLKSMLKMLVSILPSCIKTRSGVEWWHSWKFFTEAWTNILLNLAMAQHHHHYH